MGGGRLSVFLVTPGRRKNYRIPSIFLLPLSPIADIMTIENQGTDTANARKGTAERADDERNDERDDANAGAGV